MGPMSLPSFPFLPIASPMLMQNTTKQFLIESLHHASELKDSLRILISCACKSVLAFALNHIPPLKHRIWNSVAEADPIHVLMTLVIAIIVFVSYKKIVSKLIKSACPQTRGENAVKSEEQVLSTQDTKICHMFDLAKTAYIPGHTERVMQGVRQRQLDINYQLSSDHGLTLFLCACLSGERKLVKFLLDHGADVNVKLDDGNSAFYLATFGVLNSKKVDIQVLQDLIRAGCDVNETNNKGYTSLHRAASKGNKDVVDFLLKNGSDPYKASNMGIFPIDSAVSAGHLELAESLEINLDNPFVWDMVDPHTPTRIALGLQSPCKKHLMESTVPRKVNLFKSYIES